jgi:hypothetical protein
MLIAQWALGDRRVGSWAHVHPARLGATPSPCTRSVQSMPLAIHSHWSTTSLTYWSWIGYGSRAVGATYFVRAALRDGVAALQATGRYRVEPGLVRRGARRSPVVSRAEGRLWLVERGWRLHPSSGEYRMSVLVGQTWVAVKSVEF